MIYTNENLFQAFLDLNPAAANYFNNNPNEYVNENAADRIFSDALSNAGTGIGNFFGNIEKGLISPLTLPLILVAGIAVLFLSKK